MDTITKVSVNGTVYNLGGSGGGSLPTETTYSELVALRDGGNLTPGAKYRITDYTAAFKTLKSAGHKFDIVVEALSASSVSEKASALPHDGDEYFASSHLECWELWYSLDNDTSRFSEASESGKGFIYRMRDEYNNDVCFDFKNALFTLDKETFAFPTADSLDFYLFSYHTGTAGDFSSQDDIADFSTLSPKDVHDNTVSFALKNTAGAAFRTVLLKDKYILDIVQKGEICGNTISDDDVVVAAAQTATYIRNNRFLCPVKTVGLVSNVNNCTFCKLSGGITMGGEGTFSLIDTTVSVSTLAAAGNSTISITGCDIVESGSSACMLTLVANMSGCTVRIYSQGSTQGILLPDTAALTNKLVYATGSDGSYTHKVIDPMEL